MKLEEVLNFILVCFGMALVGASYSLPVPIYPNEVSKWGTNQWNLFK